MPCVAPSNARVRVIPNDPCFDVTYPTLNGEARRLCTEPILTIRPQPCAFIDGHGYLDSRKGAVSITAIIVSQISSGKSSTALIDWNPALLTRISTFP